MLHGRGRHREHRKTGMFGRELEFPAPSSLEDARQRKRAAGLRQKELERRQTYFRKQESQGTMTEADRANQRGVWTSYQLSVAESTFLNAWIRAEVKRIEGLSSASRVMEMLELLRSLLEGIDAPATNTRSRGIHQRLRACMQIQKPGKGLMCAKALLSEGHELLLTLPARGPSPDRDAKISDLGAYAASLAQI